MLEKIPYQPLRKPVNDLAHGWIPRFLHRDSSTPQTVQISDDFYGTRRRLRIGVLGAGLTGINFLHFLQQSIPAESVDVIVYEKNEDVGGVWCSSRYPGCRSDISGASYQFSWRPNVWSEFYPPAAEIRQYMHDAVRDRDFYRFIKLKHEITQAIWKDEEAQWTLSVRDLTTGQTFDDKVDLFLEFNGPVSNPQINVPGIDDFKGTIVHPANWDEKTDLKGKRIALIGYGSTGVQIAPYLVKDASKFYTWHRNRTFIHPPPTPQFAGDDGANFLFSDEQKQLLADPDVNLAYRKAIDSLSYAVLPSMINGNFISGMAKEMTTSWMKEKLATKPEIFEQMIPSEFDVGCRRPAFSYGYLEALVNEKTTFLPKPPQKFTAKGLMDAEGVEHELDIIVAATGFDQTHLPRYPKFVNGVDMRKKWESLATPPSYMGMTLGGMPNYFNPSSAYAPLQASFFLVSEPMTRYIVKVIDKMQMEQVRTLIAKPRAIEHFVRHADAFSERVVQGGPCAAWYKNPGTGKPALWPGGRTHFLKVLDTPRFEDYDMTYMDENDMFAYMANGFDHEIDGSEDADRTWYIPSPEKEVPDEILEKLRGVYGTAVIPAAETELEAVPQPTTRSSNPSKL